MVTMKDVAQDAGVSISTVSNIVNGATTVNSELVKKVEFSMNKLGYIPNAKAQSLRSKKSNTIGIIIPSITDEIYSNILLGIQNTAKFQDYKTILYTTGDLPDLEIEALNNLRTQQVEALIISSCIPDDISHIKALADIGTKIIFIQRKPSRYIESSFISTCEYNAIYNQVKNLHAKGYQSLSLISLNQAFTNEKNCIEAFEKACNDFKIEIVGTAMISMGKEQAFKITSWWMQKNKIPEAIITTNPTTANGVKASVDFFGDKIKPLVFSIRNFSWSENLFTSEPLLLDYQEVGIRACTKAFDMLHNSSTKRNESILIKPYNADLEIYDLKQHSPTEIKVLLVEDTTAHALKLLSSKFEKLTNISILIDTLKKEDFNTCSAANLNHYDIIQVHQSQLHHLATEKALLNITHTILPSTLTRTYAHKILSNYSMVSHQYFAVPYVLNTQLLFYRSDLFTSLHLKRLYYETYKTELMPPKSYVEFEQVAHFFTQAMNPQSPVPYGVALSTNPDDLVHSFVLRLWELLGEPSFENLTLEIIDQVLVQLKNIYQYTNPTDSTLTQQIETLNMGTAAMGIISQADYLNYINSKFATSNDMIYATKVPNDYTLQKGYSLSITSSSTHVDECLTYLNWLSTEDVTLINTLLGGAQPSKKVIYSNELSLINPWIALGTEQADTAHTITLQKGNPLDHASQKQLSELLNLALFVQDLSTELCSKILQLLV